MRLGVEISIIVASMALGCTNEDQTLDLAPALPDTTLPDHDDSWNQHLEVMPDGSVTYHGLPQYAVPSAVELLRTVIEYGYELPEDLREAFRAAREEG